MSNSIFPLTLKGVDVKVARAIIYSTEIQTSESGKEQRASFQSTPRYKYTVTFNFLRQSLNGDEAKTLADFHAAHFGQYDSFLFNDPFDGTQRRVRFDGDQLDMERIALNTVGGGGQTWAAKTVKLISVK